MKEWFKARNLWGSALETLSDADAGCLMKALWRYTSTGEEVEIKDSLKGFFVMMTLSLKQDEQKERELSEKRSAAGAIGGNQRVANQAIASDVMETKQDQADAYIKNKNKNIDKEKEIDKETDKDNDYEIGEDAAVAIVKEQDQVISAAENSGFPRNDATRAKLVDLYAEHGMKKMLEAIDACVNQGKSSLAYLQGVLRAEPKKAKPTKTVVAQNYSQRTYDSEQEDAMARMIAMGTG